MRQFNKRVTIHHILRLAPEHVKAAEAFLNELPPGWEASVPKSCRLADGSLDNPLITRAILYVLDPIGHPCNRPIQLCAILLRELHEIYRGS
jgi:hypothetical protein